MKVRIYNKENRQVSISTSSLGAPEETYQIPPRGIRVLNLTTEQKSFVRATYKKLIIT